MPFLHAGRVFTILFTDDFSFSEVRAVLDYLLACNAFAHEVQESRIHYRVTVDEVDLEVWVRDMDVFIKRD